MIVHFCAREPHGGAVTSPIAVPPFSPRPSSSVGTEGSSSRQGANTEGHFCQVGAGSIPAAGRPFFLSRDEIC